MPNWFTSFITHPVVLLMLGGGVGTNARYWLGRFVAAWQLQRFPHMEFPWGTFIINVSGSMILGFAVVLFRNHPDEARKNWYLLLGTGFCGGYTTFSTFSVETVELMQDGRPWNAAAYVLGSVAAGVLGAWLAMKVGRP